MVPNGLLEIPKKICSFFLFPLETSSKDLRPGNPFVQWRLREDFNKTLSWRENDLQVSHVTMGRSSEARKLTNTHCHSNSNTTRKSASTQFWPRSHRTQRQWRKRTCCCQFTQHASEMKGFGSKFACASCVNWALVSASLLKLCPCQNRSPKQIDLTLALTQQNKKQCTTTLWVRRRVTVIPGEPHPPSLETARVKPLKCDSLLDVALLAVQQRIHVTSVVFNVRFCSSIECQILQF